MAALDDRTRSNAGHAERGTARYAGRDFTEGEIAIRACRRPEADGRPAGSAGSSPTAEDGGEPRVARRRAMSSSMPPEPAAVPRHAESFSTRMRYGAGCRHGRRRRSRRDHAIGWSPETRARVPRAVPPAFMPSSARHARRLDVCETPRLRLQGRQLHIGYHVDTKNQRALPKKHIWLCPLQRLEADSTVHRDAHAEAECRDAILTPEGGEPEWRRRDREPAVSSRPPPGHIAGCADGGASSQKIAICRSVIASKLVSRKWRRPSAAGASWRSR